MRKGGVLGVLLFALPLLGGCWEDSLLEANPEGRIVIVEDPVLLSERVEYRHELLTLRPATTSSPGASGIAAAPPGGGGDLQLGFVAEIAAPVLSGLTLQATHVVVHDQQAYVSYNVQGDAFRGAVDVMDKVKQGNPKLVSSIGWMDAEVSAVDYDGAELFLATGAQEGSFTTTAVLERAELAQGGKTIDPATERIGLPSFVATGVAVHGGLVLVTSGDGGEVPGGLAVFDRNTLQPLGQDPFPDARAVAGSGDYVVALKGSPGELRIYDAATVTLQSTVTLGGAATPASKAGLSIAEDVAVAALGPDGLRVVDLRSGAVIGELSLPAVGGIDPNDLAANDVAVHEDLVFAALGAGGLWVARASERLDQLSLGSTVTLTWEGELAFPDQSSVNFVTEAGGQLFVAGGLGGLKIVSFD